VWLHHASAKDQTAKTSREGRFEIETSAPAIVFRKEGFNAKYYRFERDANVEVQLDPIANSLRTCQTSADCRSLNGFMSEFCLPTVPGIKATQQRNDLDYGQRLYLIQTATGRKRIQHAAGPMWSGLPLDEDVWSAVDYTERDYRDLEGFLIVDARGSTADGKRWRVLGRAFETASYRELSPDEANLLDRVLDGACLRLQPNK
jgi:hypothetical protein